jgi:uncharacterized protein YjiS (DUF1127 family)
MTQAIIAAHSYSTRAIELLINLFKDYLKYRARQAQIKQTIRELQQLSDHELNDIGFARGDIVSVARGDKDMKKKASYAETNDNMKGWV